MHAQDLRPATKEAFTLFHKGAVALAEMECIGIPISLERLDASEIEVRQNIRELESTLREHPVYEAQRMRFGKETNINSRPQLAHILFHELGVPHLGKSSSGKYKFDDEVIAELEVPDNIHDYLETYRALQKLYKLQGTYIDGLRKETVNGRIHGFINLHSVTTYRGSADSPNLNNLPTRNPLVAKHIKGAIVPTPGFAIVEIDYSALEVHIAACYHKDPTMMHYLESGYDMHSDMAVECFLLEDGYRQANPKKFKQIRQETKSGFVFSAMYGNYHVDMAKQLWKVARKMGLLEHLAAKGITSLGVVPEGEECRVVYAPNTYVQHIKRVEEAFWGKRFPVYDRWRKDWFRSYCTKGYFETLTGFRVHGVWKRNEVINSPVQGSAFHCLLQAVIDVQAEAKRRGMRSRPILEIHDSMVSEVALDELDDYIAMSTRIMTTSLQAKWKWIIMDLKVEVEVGRDSWYDKTAYKG